MFFKSYSWEHTFAKDAPCEIKTITQNFQNKFYEAVLLK